MRIFKNINIDFLSKRKYFYILSLTIFALGVANIAIRGLKLGIDFLGGTEIALEFEKPVEINTIRKHINNIGLGEMEIKTFGGDKSILMRTELQEIPANMFHEVQNNIEESLDESYPGIPRRVVSTSANSVIYAFSNADTTELVSQGLFNAGYQTAVISPEPATTQMLVRVGIADWIKENLRKKMPDNNFKVLKADNIGPKVGKELKWDAIWAITFALLGILLYLWVRFKWSFSVGAVLALFHDVLITLGLYSILYGVVPLNLEIDLTIVGAFLTIVGYSVSDTVVIFDRIRENMKLHKTIPIMENINKAINQTMSRTILTGGSTLLSLLVLVLFGGEVLKPFAFTLFFGIIIGTYSSIFVASAFVYDYSRWSKRKIEF